MSELTEFLLARLAEDEQRARNDGADAMTGARWKHYPEGAYYELQTRTLAVSSRTLAECEAKRWIVAECADLAYSAGVFSTGEEELAVTILCALAQPYADHPDFREEWRA